MPGREEVGVVEDHGGIAEDVVDVPGDCALPHVLTCRRAGASTSLAASKECVLLADETHVIQHSLIRLDPQRQRLRIALRPGVVKRGQCLRGSGVGAGSTLRGVGGGREVVGVVGVLNREVLGVEIVGRELRVAGCRLGCLCMRSGSRRE